MSYLALYRRFRPVTFDQMIGQEHIVRTLTNQIQSGRIGHAYLFCGTRGTGKTTAAKIFARAINCEHPVNGSPCGECETCKALSDPANLDIVEMDAASNNKVENIREIRDKVQYPPVAGRYKVYIIDEVHMLTPEAFNALLKTLEEPPAHAVFILATTEQHKLPSTILSRCMRFDFKLIPDELIVSLIERIYDELGKEYEKEAVVKIARSGEGCVRDALSVADLCLSFSDKKLTYNDVIDVLGASDNKKTYELLEGVFDCLPDKALSVTEEMCASGKSVGLTCKEVQGVLREVLIAKTCGDYKKVLSLPDSELNTIKSLADRIDEHRMLRILEIFSAVENDLKYSTHPRVVFETAVLKSTMPCEDYNVDALIGRIERLEKQLKQIEENGVKVPLSVDYRQISPQREAIKGGLKPETGAATAEVVDDARAENAVSQSDDDDLPPFDMGDTPNDASDKPPFKADASKADERENSPS
ncbi:MAG: DNA polymerase III subunit gamma/tau, partial [Clostridia bacterium]|nr:DNA polymerase III subunit gamma/tau [Clostridia bacterium]